MNQIEVRQQETLTEHQQALLYFHSIINIYKIIETDITLLYETCSDAGDLQPAVKKVEETLESLVSLEAPHIAIDKLRDSNASVLVNLENTTSRFMPDTTSDQTLKIVANLRNLFRYLDLRLQEIVNRSRNPGKWELVRIEDLEERIHSSLIVIEKNAKGAYKILKNPAARSDSDYLFNVVLEGVKRETLYMPPELSDVFRDLFANARKYTNPGGTISGGILDNGKEIRLAVEDTGVGILPEEMDKVCLFGFRGSNLAERRTMGGGYCLTKAAWVAHSCGGRMIIRSKPDHGTQISIVIPRPTNG